MGPGCPGVDGAMSDTQSQTRMTINAGGKTITLIGTAHVSKESIEEVRSVILEEKPDMVCIELDKGRYDSMNNNSWEKLDVAKVLREGKGFLLMANLVLAGFQRRLGSELGVKPGEEMRAALDAAKEMNAPHALCDREVQITLRRAWSKCGFWNKSKLLASLLASAFTTEKLTEEEIENLKNRSELDGMMNELANYLPPVKETLIDERDQYLAAKIWTAGGTRPLAVVGAGHMDGIKAHLEKIAGGEESADVTLLDEIPPRGFFSRVSRWIIPALLVGIVAYGIFKQQGNFSSINMLLTWLLWNGGLAALGAIIALGHPLSVLVSLLGAPVTSATPVIGVGILSGLAEIYVRKPRVQDAQSINDDIGSLKGMYRNRIIHALLVFFLSSLGSMVGTFIAIPSIVGQLFR